MPKDLMDYMYSALNSAKMYLESNAPKAYPLDQVKAAIALYEGYTQKPDGATVAGVRISPKDEVITSIKIQGFKPQEIDYEWEERNKEGYPLHEVKPIDGFFDLPIISDLSEIKEPFGKLDRSTQMRLFEAWLEGNDIEFFHSSEEWQRIAYPAWNPKIPFRVQPKPQRDIQVPWDYLPDWMHWVARDRDGRVCSYEGKPSSDGARWYYTGRGGLLHLKDVGTKPWDQSLIRRPIMEGEYE